MTAYLSTPCTAFAGTRRVASGALIDVALAIKAVQDETQGLVLAFDDVSGAVIDLDLRGSTAEIVTRLTKRDEPGGPGGEIRGGLTGGPGRSRGRPRLGVIAREVTLLPRHWEWLARQPGGASPALRRLIDEARRADDGQTGRRAAHERAYRFLSALAGDLQNYEEAIRNLFADKYDAFAGQMATWPPDVRDHALALARLGPEEGRS